MSDSMHPIPHDPKDVEPGGLVLTELVDKVPTAYLPEGGGFLDWSVTPMPAADRVERFLDHLSNGTKFEIPAGEFATDNPETDNFNIWWRLYVPVGDDTDPDPLDSDSVTSTISCPSDHWAQPLTDRERALLDRACPVLSCELWASLINSIKETGTYPPDWGSSSGQFRATGDRFFDRLRLTFLSSGWHTPYDSRRRADWTSHIGKPMDPQTTVFARRHPDNALHSLHVKLADGGSTLGSLVGLADVPDDFAFPLAWSEAVHSGLAEETTAELPADLRTRLKGFANDVEAGIASLDSVTFWARLAAVGLLLSSLSLPAGGLAVFVGAVSDKLGDAVAHWPAALRRAADSDATLDDAAYELLHMLRTTNYDGVFENAIEGALDLEEKVLFVGLPHGEVWDLERALRPGHSPFEPMILLGDAFAEYGMRFGNSPFEVGTVRAKSVVSEQRQAMALWTKWWNSAKPTLDLAYVLETVGIAAQQLLHLDDALLALETMANGEGLVAASLRSSIAEQDQAAFADALGGVSLSGGVRYLLRQTLSDLFVDWVAMDEQHDGVPVAERADLAGIRTILPWMSSNTERAAIDAALGPMLEVTEDNAGEQWPAFTGVRILLGYVKIGSPRWDFPLSIRGWLLPEAPDADRGAFGRMLSAIAASADSDLPAPDISLVDLARIREWITGARQSDLVELRPILEPNWTFPSDAPDIPDDLPRDDIEPI